MPHFLICFFSRILLKALYFLSWSINSCFLSLRKSNDDDASSRDNNDDGMECFLEWYQNISNISKENSRNSFDSISSDGVISSCSLLSLQIMFAWCSSTQIISSSVDGDYHFISNAWNVFVTFLNDPPIIVWYETVIWGGCPLCVSHDVCHYVPFSDISFDGLLGLGCVTHLFFYPLFGAEFTFFLFSSTLRWWCIKNSFEEMMLGLDYVTWSSCLFFHTRFHVKIS